MKKPKIGRGKNTSIAKAALIVFNRHDNLDFVYTGDLDFMHEVIDEAGANHASMFTAQQVAGCLNSSPYWKADGRIKSWMGRWANCYEPSKKGIKHYNKYLKQREAI